MKNRVHGKSNKNIVNIIYIVLLLVLNLRAENSPAWMEYIIRDEITDSDYINAQMILDPLTISTICITMSDSDYDLLINQISNNTYLLADMTYESPTIPLQNIEEVGIRLRGAAARHTNKKSFKISFRAFGHDDREFYSLRKINLNCDFQDPHLMRAKTCTDLFRLMGVDAARVGYTKLYINGDYRGLFANYEDIDKVLLETRFGDDNGDLYKCDGASFINGSGGYELTTNEETSDNSDILEFINVLNNTPEDNFKEEIEKVFDVDEMLMSTACNVLLGAWDDYWVLAKNFYMYHDIVSDRFKHIPHDFDGSLGTYWYPKDMDVAYQNVYNWSPTPERPRPMILNLLAEPEYRNRYTHYLMLLCMYPFSLEAMEPEIDRTANMIRETLVNDPFWEWSTLNFEIAFHHGLAGTNVKYGLKEYITIRRNSALEQLEEIGPFIKQVSRSPLLPSESDSVTISHLVVDIDEVNSVNLFYKVGNTIREIAMNDSGINVDEEAADFVYTAIIPHQENTDQVKYYVEATDVNGKISRYPAFGEWDSYPINYAPPKIVINEILASNDSVLHDNIGEYDDWFELYNPGDESVDISGMYVTDNLSAPKKWKLNNLTIPAKGFVLLWADSDPEQGSDHVGFKLSSNGEELGIFDTDEHQNIAIDNVHFGPQTTNISYGRIQDGADEWFYYNDPTPGIGNRDTVEIIIIEDLDDITDFEGVVIEGSNDNEPWPGIGSPTGEEIENLIDNDVNTKYLVGEVASWIDITTPIDVKVNGYTITSANDAPQRDPRSWIFQGWNESTGDWITLHTVTGNPSWLDFFTPKTWTFQNKQCFSTYRLSIYEINGSTQNYMQISELQIWGEVGNTNILDEPMISVAEFELFRNYPNPFNPTTNIQYSIDKDKFVNLSIFDVTGRKVCELVNRFQTQGTYSLQWDAKSDKGVKLSSGIYFCFMKTHEKTSTIKMLLMH